MSILKDIVAHWGFVDSEQLKVLAKEFPRMKLVIKWGGMPREEALACNVADRINRVEESNQDYVREVFQKRKLKEVCTIAQAIEGIADELYEKRKNDDDIMFQLKNIAGSLDFISQYLYDISWELKKKNDNVVDTDKAIL